MTQIKKHKIHLVISLATIAISLYLGSSSFKTNSVMMIYPIILGVIIEVWRQTGNKPAEQKIGLLIALVTCVIISVLSIVSYNFQVSFLEQRMNKLIQSINEYEKVNHKYPEELSILIPSYIKEIPKCNRYTDAPFYHQNSDSFNLTCYTFAFLKHTYSSKSNQWYSWD